MSKKSNEMRLFGEIILHENDICYDLSKGIQIPYDEFNSMWTTALYLQTERTDIKGYTLSTTLKRPFVINSVVHGETELFRQIEISNENYWKITVACNSTNKDGEATATLWYDDRASCDFGQLRYSAARIMFFNELHIERIYEIVTKSEISGFENGHIWIESNDSESFENRCVWIDPNNSNFNL
jgi:hypothetical protein